MEMVTSSLYAMATSLGKKSNEEIMSLDVDIVKCPGGRSKRMRQSLKKKMVEGTSALIFVTTDIIQSTMDASKELVQVIQEIV